MLCGLSQFEKLGWSCKLIGDDGFGLKNSKPREDWINGFKFV
jgi:hypothetical protein